MRRRLSEFPRVTKRALIAYAKGYEKLPDEEKARIWRGLLELPQRPS
jgi:hypothetical protein